MHGHDAPLSMHNVILVCKGYNKALELLPALPGKASVAAAVACFEMGGWVESPQIHPPRNDFQAAPSRLREGGAGGGGGQGE